jgi:hypothetical protein
MIGELMCGSTWTFTQCRWHKILGKLDNYECNEIAEYLGTLLIRCMKERKNKSSA